MPSFLILLVLLGLMYFVLIVPRQRELKRQTQLIAELAEDQEVMTGAGVYGTIRWIRDDRVGLEVADGVLLEVAKRSIAMRVADTTTVTDEGDKPEEVVADEPGLGEE